MPPSGAPTGEKSGAPPSPSICLKLVRRENDGVCGMMSDPLRFGKTLTLFSDVEMESPRLLGFRFGAMTGITNEGEAGADKAWPCEVLDVSKLARRGSEEPMDGRFAPKVFTDRFFVFRGFLFGESERLNPGRLGDGLEGKLDRNMLSSSELGVATLEELREDIGSREVGESGDELGDDSVSVESTVDMVVVGEDSVDSVRMVFEESRR